MQKARFFFPRKACMPAQQRERDASQPIIFDIIYVKMYFSPHDRQRGRVYTHGLFRDIQIPPEMWSVSGQFWKDWLVSHRAPTCLPPRFSFNSWPRVKMAASHTGSLGSQSDQFSGSQETSASLSLSASLSNHLFGACGRGNRNGELRLVLLRFNHSLQRVSCFSLSRWQRGGKWSSTLPRLNSCTSDPDETDISLHLHCPSSSLAAHAELFY